MHWSYNFLILQLTRTRPGSRHFIMPGLGGCTPPKKSGYYDPVLKKTQLTFSSNDVSKAFGKLDAPLLVLVTILSCALVVRL